MTALSLSMTFCQMDGRLWCLQGSTQFSQLPALSLLSGVVFLSQPIVQVLGPTGLLDTSYTGPVTLTATGATLNGTTTVLAVAGVATFVGLSLSGSGTANLVATAPQRLVAVSANITVA